MAEPFATIENLREHWAGLPEDHESDAAQKLIEASIIIRGLYPAVDAWLASGRLKAETVRFVVCDVVATAIRRVLEAEQGDNVQQETFSAGPYSQTLAYRIREANLFLSKLHKQLLTGGGARNRKAFMITPELP